MYDGVPWGRAVMALLMLAGTFAALLGAQPRPAPPHPAATPTPTATPRPARPVRVQIPAIGVDARVIGLGLDRSGALEPPERFDEAGWWAGGARPGERGPAVIAGHVDSKTGPAVFFRLGDLRRGDAVVVRGRDGRRIRFLVRAVEHYPKDHFPTARVYGRTRRPELRLITCSGTFNRATGHYLDNTVVYAADAP